MAQRASLGEESLCIIIQKIFCERDGSPLQFGACTRNSIGSLHPKLGRDPAREPMRQRELKLFAQSLIATLATVALVFVFFDPTYETNDDVTMRAFADGTGSGEPSEYLIFISLLVGRVLKRLYEIWPDFYWYDAYLYGCMVVASTAITYALLRTGLRYPWLAPLFILGIFWLFLLRPQFTIIAGLCAAASPVLILSACLRPPETRSGRVLIALLAAACFVLAILTRGSQAWLVLVTSLLVGSPLLIFLHRTVQRSWAVSLLAGVLGAGLLAASVSLHEAQTDSRVREFTEFNNARAQVQEYLVLKWKRPKDRAILQGLGWTESDLYMLAQWFISNHDPFTTEKLHKISKLSDRGLLKRPSEVREDAATEVEHLMILYGWLILGTGVFIVGLPERKRGLAVLVWGCFVIVGTCIALALSTKAVPHRVSAPLVFSSIALAILWSIAPVNDLLRRSSIVSRRLMIPSLTVAAILLVPAWANAIRENAQYRKWSELDAEDLRAYKPPGSRTMHILWGFDLEGEPFAETIRPKNMLFTSWALNSPSSWEQLAREGISRLDEDVCKRSDIVVIAPRAKLDLLADYYAERYRKSIVVEPVFIGQKLRFYRCWISSGAIPSHE